MLLKMICLYESPKILKEKSLIILHIDKNKRLFHSNAGIYVSTYSAYNRKKVVTDKIKLLIRICFISVLI